MLTYPHFEPRFPRSEWSLPTVLEHQAAAIGERPFLQWTHEGTAHSFAEVNRRVNRLARGFQEIGVRRGDRVVLFMPNSLELVFSWFAANKLGAVEAPINPAYRGSFLEHQINICGSDTVVVSDDLLERVIESLPRLSTVKRVIVAFGDRQTSALPELSGREVYDLKSLFLERDDNLGIVVKPHEIGAIIYTSGTTGLSKGVLMPHAQLYIFAQETAYTMGLTEDDTHMNGFPLFHANCQLNAVYPCLITGARSVLYERFSGTEWLERVHRSGATVSNFLGGTLQLLLSQPQTSRDKAHKLTRFFGGPVANHLLGDFKERFGVERILTAYGMTEICMPFLSPSTLLGHELPIGASGVLLDQWFDVRLVNPETDEEVSVGEVGELVIRSREPWTLNAGYVNMPDKTAEAFRNLWFHTGDAMRRDKDGWYYFVDRYKDALRRRGENISSFEVEQPIRLHPAVLDVAVIGVPADEAAGEDEVKACIVLREGQNLSAPDVIDWCESRMPAFVVPRYIEFMTQLPKTPTERIQKAELRAKRDGEIWDRVAAGHRLKEEIGRENRKRG